MVASEQDAKRQIPMWPWLLALAALVYLIESWWSVRAAARRAKSAGSPVVRPGLGASHMSRGKGGCRHECAYVRMGGDRCAVTWLGGSRVVGGAGPGGRKSLLLAGLRAAAALAMAIMLLQPQCRRSELIAEKPMLGVLIDGSQSMRDGPPGAARCDAVKKWLATPAFRRAREEYDLRFFTFDKALRDTSPEQVSYDGAETKGGRSHAGMGGPLERRRRGGLVLLSDGLDTTGSRTLASPGVPCWTLEVEKPGALARQRIVLWQIEPPRRALAGSESAVRVVTQGWGVEGREVPLEWWMEGRKIGERKVRFGHDGDVAETSLAMPPLQPGTYPFELRIPDEAASCPPGSSHSR